MKKIMLVLTLLLGGVPLAADHKNETMTPKSKDRTITVRYRGYPDERYRINWSGSVYVHVWESGGPAIPLQGKFVDDRQCHWDIVSRIDRNVYAILRLGEFLKPGATNVITSPFANEGSKSLVSPFGQNCNDAMGRWQSDINNALTYMNGNFDGLADQDYAAYRDQLRQDATVVEIKE